MKKNDKHQKETTHMRITRKNQKYLSGSKRSWPMVATRCNFFSKTGLILLVSKQQLHILFHVGCSPYTMHIKWLWLHQCFFAMENLKYTKFSWNFFKANSAILAGSQLQKTFAKWQKLQIRKWQCMSWTWQNPSLMFKKRIWIRK